MEISGSAVYVTLTSKGAQVPRENCIMVSVKYWAFFGDTRNHTNIAFHPSSPTLTSICRPALYMGPAVPYTPITAAAEAGGCWQTEAAINA